MVREKENMQVKKTISLIYRFIFIVFSVWGICQHIGFNILRMSVKMYDFTFVVDVMSFLCILAVFIVSITRSTGKLLQTFKNILTFCSIMILASNFYLVNGAMTYKWILGVLLPFMMVLDWVLFDKKGSLNFYDPLLWLLASLLLIGILSFLFNIVFGIDDFWNTLGLFSDKNDFLRLILKALGLGFLLYLADCIINAIKRKSFSKTFALIYRLLFIALEIYALSKYVGTTLVSLLSNIKYYLVLTNFLCVICICVLIIYNVIKFKSLKRTKNPFPSLKGSFTLAILSSMMATFFFGRSFLSFDLPEMILNYIAPIMMLIDWFMFDYKGMFFAYDPLLWALIPLGYYIIAMIYPSIISAYPGIYNLYNLELITGVIITVLIIGYGIYIVDRIKSK